MSKLSLVLFALYAFSATSSAAEIEKLKPALPTKEALIIPKHFLKNLKLPFPFPPLPGKHGGPFGPKLFPPPERHPKPVGPLGILNKKPITPVDSKFIGLVDHHHIGPEGPHIFDDPKFVDEKKHPHPLGLKPIHPHHSKADRPLHLKPFLPEHHVSEHKFSGPLGQEHLGPKPFGPDFSIPLLPSLEHKHPHDHSLHSVPKRPLFEPERHLEEDLLNKHKKHIPPLGPHALGLKPISPLDFKPDGPLGLKPFLPKHHVFEPEFAGPLGPKPLEPTLPIPLLPSLEHKLHHDHSLHSVPKKPLFEPERHLEEDLLIKHKKHIPPLGPHILGDPKFIDDRKHPHVLGLKPISPLDSKADGPLGHLLPKHHVIKPKFAGPLGPKPLGPILPTPFASSLEPELMHGHHLHPVPKKPLFEPEIHLEEDLLNEHKKHVRPLGPHIFGDSKFDNKHPHPLDLKPIHPLHSNADGPLGLKPFLPEPEFTGPLGPKPLGPAFSTPISSPLEPEILHDHSSHSVPKKPLFEPEPHPGNKQEKSISIKESESSVPKVIPVYEAEEEVETFKSL